MLSRRPPLTNRPGNKIGAVFRFFQPEERETYIPKNWFFSWNYFSDQGPHGKDDLSDIGLSEPGIQWIV